MQSSSVAKHPTPDRRRHQWRLAAALLATTVLAGAAATPATAAPGFGPLDAGSFGRQLESTLRGHSEFPNLAPGVAADVACYATNPAIC